MEREAAMVAGVALARGDPGATAVAAVMAALAAAEQPLWRVSVAAADCDGGGLSGFAQAWAPRLRGENSEEVVQAEDRGSLATPSRLKQENLRARDKASRLRLRRAAIHEGA